MKKLLILFTFVLLSFSGFCQDYTSLNTYAFESDDDYRQAELKIMECANYLLINPMDLEPRNRYSAIQFIVKWMGGTPHYSFAIQPEAMEITKDRPDLFSMYMACISKAALENSETTLTEKEMHEKAVDYLIDYCANEENKLKTSKGLRKIIKARNQ
ncbi:hypothetical protein [Chondrinema litorale]|uniref:hypothetical protein n=1 Tax=Chondrinema litorale TaxID=2994555 RepID=UPI002543667D|nr:hypothetical protein [Chondrinema litorale]UZR97841.1 hypothetical protein OQ292_28925 [Chondrinema litorale]